MPARPLAFRYLYKSGVIKENTVTVFGELGSVFQKGTDYDEEVDLTVPYMDLSNLIMYYSGTVADGTVGSSVEGSLRNLNAPVSNVRKFLKFTAKDHASEANHYYLGDIVLFDPITGEGASPNASCWTCIKTTTDLTSPIPELANEIATAIAQGGDANGNNATYNNNPANPGMTGVDNRGQRFIVGVMPARYNSTTGDITTSPYWSESALAKSYLAGGNYYQGEIVIYNGGAYQCRTTNGFLADPQLYQRTKYTLAQELADAAGDASAIPPLDPALAPQGAFGYDSSGTRYLMGVPPAGGLFSGLFWEPATLPKTPSGSYLNINWDNTSITSKLQFYDANVVGGGGAQSIPTFNDDIGNTITTLRKTYDDNEKSFVLTIANQILSSIPAAAIKSQAVNSKVEPDNTLVELVHLGPSNSKPSEYKPTVQGLFEESLARDMLRISGYTNTITEIVVTEGSSGYTSVPSVNINGGLATNPKLVPFKASALARLGVKSIKIDKLSNTWNSTSSGKRYAVGDVLTFVSAQAPTVACTAKVYRVDSTGNILSILVTNKGSGYSAVPAVRIGGNNVTFLEPVLEVVSVDLQSTDVGFYNDMKVVVQYGSGAGAVGYAVTQEINGVVRLKEVKFDGGTHTDGAVTYNVSPGVNYVSGNFKKDVVALQGYNGEGVAVMTAKTVGIVTKVVGTAINELVVINNGSGYTSTPRVVIASPAEDTRENAQLLGDSTTQLVTLDSFLAPVDRSGEYSLQPPCRFTVADPPTDATASNVQSKVYLGLTVADVRFGGTGYSQGEYLSVSGNITPARFNVSYDATSDSYSGLVMEGGDGYLYDSVNTYKNQIVLDSGAANADQLRAEILAMGGGLVDLTFNSGRPSGAGFTVNDVIEVVPANANSTFRFKVTSVGDEGTIAPTGFTPASEATTTGYNVGQTLFAKSKFLSIDTLTLDTPQVFTGSTQPTVTIEAPSGAVTLASGTWTPIQATASVSLKVASISVTNGGTGYSLGDVITVTQTGAESCQAFVLALSNTDTGSVGVIAVRNGGSGFDLSGTITTTLPSTSGTPLQVNVSYAVDKIVVTNPGSGYELVGGDPPGASLNSTIPLLVTTKHAGQSTGTFLVGSVDANGAPTITQLSPGAGYLVGDLLALTNIDNVATGAYVTVEATQSRGVKTGTIIPGYRGTEHTVSATLIEAPCSKVGSTTTFPPIKYAVTKVTPPTSISKFSIIDYKPGTARYPSPTSLSHKPHARVKVGSVDSLGSILSLIVESKGFGYTNLPKISPMPGTRGSGASLFAVSLGVSRVEFTGATLSVINSTDISLYAFGISPAPSKPNATATAQLAGDLNMIDTDAVKNPNILESLELLKPGSTSGYAQAKPNMGVSSVSVVSAGRGYSTVLDSDSNPVTSVEVTPPDLPNGVKPTFSISFGANDSISSVTVLTSGSGYSKLPQALIKMSTSAEPNLPAAVTLNMKLIDGYITSGGQGYTALPTVTVSAPDVNNGQSTATLIPTMKTNVNGFDIKSPGAQYITTPEALVVGPGDGAEAVASMGVSDIYVVNGGSGYSVGDMLQISAPTGTDGENANATVLAVTSSGTITRVGLVTSMFPVVAATLAARKNDFILNGGSEYQTLPTISATLKVPGAGDLYTDGVPTSTLDNSAGTGAVFSTRLGVKSLNFSAAGDLYESDATVLIQEPPSSQAANFSGIINGVGQLSAYVNNSSGNGYNAVPGAIVTGNGVGATVTPLMGVTEVSIISPGRGYSVGDAVTFTGGNPTEPASGVVTVVDAGGGGIGRDLVLAIGETERDATLSVDASGNLVGKVGAATAAITIEGGVNFQVGDVIYLKPPTRLPSQEDLDGIRCVSGNRTKLVNGKFDKIALYGPVNISTFKLGSILKVTSKNPALSSAVAYIQLNLLFNVIDGQYGVIYPGNSSGLDYASNLIGNNVSSVEFISVIASNSEWGSDLTLIVNSPSDPTPKLNYEVMVPNETTYPNSTAYFKVTSVLSSVGAVRTAVPCNSDGTTAGVTSTGMFYSKYDVLEYDGTPRGALSFIQILNPGSGYQSSPTAAISSSTATSQATLITSLGVAALRIDQRGSGYTTNPNIVIEAPRHRALGAKGYARSGVFDIDVHDFEILDQGSGYTGQYLDANSTLADGGTYRLVGGALHDTGGSAESVDTVLTINPGAFVGGLLSRDVTAIRAAASILIRGSNYRIGDLVQLVAIGSTQSGNLATPAKLRIKQISKSLDRNNGMGESNSQHNTGVGILDYGKQENGEDVGAYGTGYFNRPRVTILGGNQGVTLATSLGVVAVDRSSEEWAGGADYEVGDLVQIVSPAFINPVTIGVVSRVDGYTGEVTNATIYEPYSKGITTLPSVTVVRANPTHRSNYSATLVSNGTWVRRDVNLFAVMGVTSVATTTSSDGFIGRPYVFLDAPTGRGNIQQPTSARISPIVVTEVGAVNVFYDNTTPEYVTTVPSISIAPPPSIEKYSGWRSVRFNKDDSFEAIVQYTIAKAVSFQVDPDATLPGYYFTATAITIGGVVIPLRQSGGKGMQGRELSANRIIRRYKVKLIAV